MHQNDQCTKEMLPRPNKIALWKLDKYQIIALLIGTILYVPLMHTLVFISAYNSYIYPATLISLLFGLRYGPWVGLAVGGGGTFIDNFVSTQGHFAVWVAWSPWQRIDEGLNWKVPVAFALVGFIAGLSVWQTQGRFTTSRAVRIALAFSLLALFASFAFLSLLPPSEFSIAWIGDSCCTAYFDCFGLVLLLACYKRLTRQSAEETRA